MGLFLSVFDIKMKIELCAYSGYKIYPCRGRTLVKSDGKVFKFLDGRSMKAHLLKRNPRKVTWTVLYRRKHKKGIEEEAAKKTQKFQRAVVGATLQDIMAKRNQKPEVRKAQREQAIRAAKELKKTTKATTKKPAAGAAPKAKAAKAAQKAQKPMQKAAPRVGGKR